MALTPHTIQPARGSKTRSKRVGRGPGSGRGTYSARGLKGQRARSGGRGGLKLYGLKSRLQKIPKLRGFQSLVPKAATVDLARLLKVCADGSVVSPKMLVRNGLVPRSAVRVKIIGRAAVDKKLTIRGCAVSAGVAAAVTQAGGTVEAA